MMFTILDISSLTKSSWWEGDACDAIAARRYGDTGTTTELGCDDTKTRRTDREEDNKRGLCVE